MGAMLGSGYTSAILGLRTVEVQPMTFAEKLRELRDRAGLSEAKLARASGIPFATIRSYGAGVRSPSLKAAVKIARALGTDCRAFADCEDIGGEPGRKKNGKRKREN